MALKKSEYVCDWCKREPLPQHEMHRIVVTPVQSIHPQHIVADICDICFEALKQFVETVTKE